MPNHICHHEIPADDPVRAMNFYKSIFDWKFQDIDMGESGHYYIFCTGAETGGGGICKKCPEGGSVVNYVTVDDIPAMCDKVRANGGIVVLEKTAIGGNYGFMALCKDTEDNMFGLWSQD